MIHFIRHFPLIFIDEIIFVIGRIMILDAFYTKQNIFVHYSKISEIYVI